MVLDIKTADTIANTTLKEYEHALNLRGSVSLFNFSSRLAKILLLEPSGDISLVSWTHTKCL